MQFRSTRHSTGFTLIELMIAIAVLAIVLVLAGPSYSDFVQRRQLNTLAVDLVAGIHLARSEAITQRDTVSLQPVGGDWADGWEVVTSGGSVLFEQGPYPTGYSFNMASGSADFTFNSRGRLARPDTFTITNNNSDSQVINLPASGNPYIR